MLLFAALAHAVIKQGAINVAVYGFEYPQNTGAAVYTLEASGYNANPVMLSDIAGGYSRGTTSRSYRHARLRRRRLGRRRAAQA